MYSLNIPVLPCFCFSTCLFLLRQWRWQSHRRIWWGTLTLKVKSLLSPLWEKIVITAVVVVVVWCMQIARNITTNELWNTRRFSYLRGPDGRFYNPYNHGWRRNCSDFLVNGYTRDDEVVPSSILWITSHYYRRTHLDSVYCVYGISPRLILFPRGREFLLLIILWSHQYFSSFTTCYLNPGKWPIPL